MVQTWSWGCLSVQYQTILHFIKLHFCRNQLFSFSMTNPEWYSYIPQNQVDRISHKTHLIQTKFWRKNCWYSDGEEGRLGACLGDSWAENWIRSLWWNIQKLLSRCCLVSEENEIVERQDRRLAFLKLKNAQTLISNDITHLQVSTTWSVPDEIWYSLFNNSNRVGNFSILALLLCCISPKIIEKSRFYVFHPYCCIKLFLIIITINGYNSSTLSFKRAGLLLLVLPLPQYLTTISPSAGQNPFS